MLFSTSDKLKANTNCIKTGHSIARKIKAVTQNAVNHGLQLIPIKENRENRETKEKEIETDTYASRRSETITETQGLSSASYSDNDSGGDGGSSPPYSSVLCLSDALSLYRGVLSFSDAMLLRA
ncbi:uncharacterized protein G2W53_041687 [Senna tora]|uniref:Uncharacterized protein n=1 Tax=Senna tora TaxID=362788 RepID=A0A834SFF1_9FABA|nr:uncharacterized protein G2W53_041687 [Senna tora]